MPRLNPKKLLIIPCSKTKNSFAYIPEVGFPAWHYYDGGIFRVIKNRIQRNEWPHKDVEVLILSAEYGLMHANQHITPYDRLMTPQRARELRSDVKSTLSLWVKHFSVNELFICLGKTYKKAMPERYPEGVQVTYLDGMIGQKLSQIKNIWKVA
jgi:cytoplasmic iron level regulating protein YaaA (DUF328/UPF0246 family)